MSQASNSSSALLKGIVRQPVLVLLAIAVLSVIGAIIVVDLPIEAFPDVQDTQVQVITQAPGRAPEEVERSISQPLERELGGTPKATRIRSVSITGLSVVTATFEDGTNDFFARAQVLERIQNASLPSGVTPQLAPLSNAVGEIFRYVVEAPASIPKDEVRVLQDWLIRPALRVVPLVADIVSFGGAVRELQVRVDPAKMVRYRLTMDELQKAITAGGDNAGGGVMRRGDQSFVIRGLALYRSAKDLAAAVVAADDGKPVRVGDVAEVGYGERPRAGIVSHADAEGNADDVVEGIVQMTKGSNAAVVVKAVDEKVLQINERLAREAPGVKLVPIYRRTDLVGHTVATVVENLLLGAALVLAILLLFLRRWSAALIVACVIPVALLLAFMCMQLAKVPANLMSLGAVDFGVIIDSAVVLIEALMVRLGTGAVTAEQRLKALELTLGQMAKPILFSKVIIIAAFAPIFSFQRVEGRIFTPVALTLSLALAAGLILTLTLVPALLSKWLAKHPLEEAHLGWMSWLSTRYKAMLQKLVSKTMLVVAAAIAVLIGTLALSPLLGSEFLPKLDEGNIWLTVGLAPSSSLEHTKSIERDVRRALTKYPEVSRVIGQVGRPDDGTDPKGANNLEMLAQLSPKEKWRFENKEALVADMAKALSTIPGVTANFSQVIQDNMEEALSGAKGEVVAKIFGPDLAVLEAKANIVAQIVGKIRGAVDVAALPVAGQPEIDIQWRRDQLERYGLLAADVNRLVSSAIGGVPVGSFFEGQRSFDITMRLQQSARSSIDDISQLPIPLPMPSPLPPNSVPGTVASIPLASLATVQVRDGASRITREAGERNVTVKLNLSGRDLGSFVAEARDKVAKDVTLPVGYRLEWGGQFENQQRAMKRLGSIVPLACLAVLTLLVLALRSLRPAVLVVAVLPFALIGGFAGLALAGLHLSVSAAVGFIAVAGIAVQNGLILVERIVEMNSLNAAIDAASERLRPILMTALMAGLGLLPAALSHGIGAETQRPFAVVIVGGIVSATIATLLLLPLVANRWIKPQVSLVPVAQEL
jgi:heavy metal efflux system protein